MVDSAAPLVDEVLPRQPMSRWILSVPFPLRFEFAGQPFVTGKVVGIAHRAIATHLPHKAGCIKTTAHTGAVTLKRRSGNALNTNVHVYVLFSDEACIGRTNAPPVRFRWIQAPTSDELTQLTHINAWPFARYLERQGLPVRDVHGAWLTSFAGGEEDEVAFHQLPGTRTNSVRPRETK